MLDHAILTQLREVFAGLDSTLQLVLSPSSHDKQDELHTLLTEVASTSSHISVRREGPAGGADCAAWCPRGARGRSLAVAAVAAGAAPRGGAQAYRESGRLGGSAKRVARSRSKGVGLPPRCKWPRTVTRHSRSIRSFRSPATRWAIPPRRPLSR